jgi:hypothetical protein
MRALHLVFLVEEYSMEAFLRGLLPRVLPEDRTFEIFPFQGKADMKAKLPARLRAYARWLPQDWRILDVVDCDNEDCHILKQELESIASSAGLRTRSSVGPSRWQLANSIAVEELEAWYFGEWQAVCAAFPKVSPNAIHQGRYYRSNAIAGGTWEALERVLQRFGYFKSGLRKAEAARAISAHINAGASKSASFQRFHEAIIEAVA